MALQTTLEQLEAIQTAITAVLEGQEVSIKGKSLTRADLKTLYEREDVLLARYRREQGTGGMRTIHGIPRRD